MKCIRLIEQALYDMQRWQQPSNEGGNCSPFSPNHCNGAHNDEQQRDDHNRADFNLKSKIIQCNYPCTSEQTDEIAQQKLGLC